MAARDIERFNLDYTFDEILFRWAKRGCFAFAGIALMLGALDIAGVHSVSTAGSFWRNAHANVASLGAQIRSGDLAIIGDGNAVTARVETVRSATRAPSNTLDRLAAERGRDAMEVALGPSLPGFKQDLMTAEKTVVVPDRALAQAGTKSDAAPAKTASIKPAPAAVAKLEPKSAPASAVAVTPAALTPSQPAVTQLASLSPEAASANARAVEGADAPGYQLASIAPDASIPPLTNAALPSPYIPLEKVPLPSPSPPIPPPSPAYRLKLDDKAYAKSLRCLANAVYFEARSEPIRGQMAVAQVVMNRVFSDFYPNDVCGVVYQNSHRRLACQFTFACDGKSKAIHDRHSWSVANRIARQTLDGQIYLPEVGKSTHYHAAYVRPIWAREMRKLARFGLHSFYRPYAWGNGAELPTWGKAMAQVKKPVSH
ncbi:MAG: cell wall hydrolase [Xanthobacteraceae bacterium]|uniref:cell wall hydrolase n=1 Tax=Pseudolabrys sp. TaxID=1960880 RepID=UPI003D13F742